MGRGGGGGGRERREGEGGGGMGVVEWQRVGKGYFYVVGKTHIDFSPLDFTSLLSSYAPVD